MVKKLTVVAVLAGIISFSGIRTAVAEVPVKGGACWASLNFKATLGPDVEFNCEHVGKLTIRQLYERGYRVVAVYSNPAHPSFVSIVIEEQR